jgi:hypothetical protein
MLSTKELMDTKLTGNDGAYKTEDNVMDGVHFTVPTRVDPFDRLISSIGYLDGLFMHWWMWSI